MVTAPAFAYVFYLLKIGLYIGGFLAFCRVTPSLGGPSTFGTWWASPLAFEKAILWSMLFEGLGFGCGSGPLTGRYFPPIVGFLHFIRPGTTKLPLFVSLPVLGGVRRTWFDVALYVALVVCVVRALVAPAIDAAMLLPIAVLVPLLGVCDRTIFLALRAEHYWTTIIVLVLAGDFVAGAKAVQLALWFWAGFSKLNHHFPAVVCVMTSNSPFTRSARLRKLMYRDFPSDLRPSRLAEVMAHMGTALELAVPIILCLADGGAMLVVGIVLALVLHAFITSNVPMGVPLEWNVMVVYGTFALFWAHPEVSALSVSPPLLAVFLVFMLIGLPLFGERLPEQALVPRVHAVLRGQLALRRMALPRRRVSQAREAHEERVMDLRTARSLLRSSHVDRPRRQGARLSPDASARARAADPRAARRVAGGGLRVPRRRTRRRPRARLELWRRPPAPRGATDRDTGAVRLRRG
jgi:hypothetical protein